MYCYYSVAFQVFLITLFVIFIIQLRYHPIESSKIIHIMDKNLSSNLFQLYPNAFKSKSPLFLISP